MLLSVLTSDQPYALKIVYLLISMFCVLLALSVHEMSHGLVAHWMGDNTAKYMGRLTLNPLHHLDPIGALCLLLFNFGWAKPVPVNPDRFGKNGKAGMVLTALGGPISNLLLAFIAEIGVLYFGNLSFASASEAQFSYKLVYVLYVLCSYMVTINLGLGIFNLIPIPPLDGSKILTAVLPTSLYFRYMEFERYGFIVVLLLMKPISYLMNFIIGNIVGFYDMIISLLPFIH